MAGSEVAEGRKEPGGGEEPPHTRCDDFGSWGLSTKGSHAVMAAKESASVLPEGVICTSRKSCHVQRPAARLGTIEASADAAP